LLKWRGDSRETSFDEGVYILDRSANAVGSLRLPRAVALWAVFYPLAIQAALERVVLFHRFLLRVAVQHRAGRSSSRRFWTAIGNNPRVVLAKFV